MTSIIILIMHNGGLLEDIHHRAVKWVELTCAKTWRGGCLLECTQHISKSMRVCLWMWVEGLNCTATIIHLKSLPSSHQCKNGD